MARWARFISTIGPIRIIRALGGVLVILAIGRLLPVGAESIPLVERLIDGFLLGGPGIALLYAGSWLPRSHLRPEVYPHITKWCLGGSGVMLGTAGLMLFNPGGSADEPYWALAVAGSLGAIGGLGIGLYNARALSRAREAEQHRDRFRAERNLRERIFETSPIGIGVVNADGSIREVNSHASQIIGVPEDELLELDYDESLFGATDPDGEPLEESIFQQVLRSGEPVYDAEGKITRPEGNQIWLSVNGAPLSDPSGEITAIVFAFEDITERKQLEKTLKETIEELERSNDRLREFTYAASHDLQEPLRMVSSYLRLLENRYKDDLDADAQEFIEFAVNGADRMREMVNDLLAYARVEQDDQEFEPVDCEVLVERVLTDLQVQIEESNAEIVTESLPTVEGDHQQLEQLFQNLVSNALKYNDAAPRVEITAEQRGNHWEFSVADNGIGIDPEHADQIFEAFQRLHHEEYSGTGVGLSLCQKIVENHGGNIWVESQPGEGSTFSFTLPGRATTQREERLP